MQDTRASKLSVAELGPSFCRAQLRQYERRGGILYAATARGLQGNALKLQNYLGSNNHQYRFEVYLRNVILWLYSKHGTITIVVIIQAPTA